MFSASVLCGSLFLEQLFARVAVLFMYMGARESCLRAYASLLCHARVKNNRDKPLLDVIIIVYLCHYH